MTGKPARKRPAREAPSEEAALRAQLEALQAEFAQMKVQMAQKDLLLDQGFQVFNQAAAKLEENQKRYQETVAALNLEIDQQNKELARNLIEKENVKNYLSNILESLAIGVFVTDLEGGVTSVNRAGLNLLGAGADALVGQNINDVLGAELLPRARRSKRSIQAHVELEEPLPFNREEGETLEFNRDDGETLQFSVAITPMTGESGAHLGYILNVQDITLLKKLEEHVSRRNRFTAMGEMAANIAHEIRNPLGSIELFASLVKKGLPEQDEKLELINHISNGIASMNHIISNLLEYTKPRPVVLKPLSLHQLLKEVVDFTRFSAQQNGVELREELDAKNCEIRGDPELLKQVFHNLILNGVQAMPEGGTLTITSRSRTLTSPKLLSRLANNAEVRPAKRPGMGMAPDIQKQIFDPFFSTKARGTGLGLAIVHNIIESHHGLIDVDSEKERGTTFLVMFPTLGT
jgi:PAS domain S-box-containing protein